MNHSLVVWETNILARSEKANIGKFADDFKIFFGIHHMDLQVTSFFPDDFLVTLADASVRDVVLEAGNMAINGQVYTFRPWDVKLHASSATFPFHTRLCIDGLSMYAWSE
ncbi:hypothetical protein ABZP36_008165 [Zizania latifolia]